MLDMAKASERPGRSKSRRPTLQNGEACIAQIGDQHRRRRVGNAKRRLRVLDRKLWRQTARPEHRKLVIGDVAVPDILIAPGQIDADRLRFANMNWCPVDVRKA